MVVKLIGDLAQVAGGFGLAALLVFSLRAVLLRSDKHHPAE